MDPTRTGPVAIAESRMRWLEARQRVLSQNIANADTPGYRPSDLRPFAQTLAGATAAQALRQTHSNHLTGSGQHPNAVRESRVPERTMNGNSVALDREALRVAETESAHQLAVSVHRRYIGMFRTALGRGG